MNDPDHNFFERVKQLSPELQLLLWSVRVDDKLKNIPGKYLNTKRSIADIEQFKRLSFSMGLLPVFYKKLKMLDRENIDRQLYEIFKEAYMEILSRNIKLSNKLERIFQLLKKNDLDLIAFKGPMLGLIAYNDIAFRSSSDLDFMVSNDEFSRVVDELREIGFSTLFPYQKKIIKYLSRSWRDIHLTKGFYHLDIHQQFAQGPSFFRINEKNMEHSRKVKLNNIEISTFSPEDSLVLMAINCAKDGFSSLKHFRDIAGIVLNNPELNWKRLFASSKEKRSLKIVMISLKLSQIFCGLELPENVLEQTDSGTVKKKADEIADRILTSGFKTDMLTSYFSFAGSLDTILSKSRFYLWYFMYPSPHIHSGIFKLPDKLFFLIRIISPFYLFFNHLSRLIRSKPGK